MPTVICPPISIQTVTGWSFFGAPNLLAAIAEPNAPANFYALTRAAEATVSSRQLDFFVDFSAIPAGSIITSVAIGANVFQSGSDLTFRFTIDDVLGSAEFHPNGTMQGQNVFSLKTWNKAVLAATRFGLITQGFSSGTLRLAEFEVSVAYTAAGGPAPTVTNVVPDKTDPSCGTAVTITGTNFVTGASVLFGGLPATSVVVVSSTTITCICPPHAAGAVSVTVTNPDTQSDTLLGHFTYVSSVSSQTGTLVGGFTYFSTIISAINPAAGSIGGGVKFVLSGYNFLTGSTITFGGVAATDVNFIDSQHLSGVTPAHAAGRVDIVVQDPAAVQTLLRHGFQYVSSTRGSSIRRQPGIVIADILGGAPNTARLTVDGAAQTPFLGEPLQVIDEQDNDRLMFAGNTQTVETSFDESTDAIRHGVTAVDPTWLLNRRRPYGKYEHERANDVVIDLVKKFAPSFTTVHVQTGLARISLTFDGSQDFSACLDTIAAAIGGGDWRAAYDQDIHFFHTPPPKLPDAPEAVMHYGPGAILAAAQGSVFGTTASFPAGYYAFASSFLYDNGVESELSGYSNFIALDGHHAINFSLIPIGASIGSLTCIGRRIYFMYVGMNAFSQSPSGIENDDNVINTTAAGVEGFIARRPFLEVPDNSTTGFSTGFNGQDASIFVRAPYAEWAFGFVPFITTPPGPANAPIPAEGIAGSQYLMPPPFSSLRQQYTWGSWGFAVSYIYRDGTESAPSPWSFDTGWANGGLGQAGIQVGQFGFLGGGNYPGSAYNTEGKYSSPPIPLSNISTGPVVNGIDVIGRKIWANYTGSAGEVTVEPFVEMWYFLPDNTTTSALIGPGMGGGLPFGDGTLTEPWPNPDGPSLELDDLPADIDDFNTDLLNPPPFSMTEELSQIANRVIVRGQGSSLTAPAYVGTNVLKVSDVHNFPPTGGLLFSEGQVFAFSGKSGRSGAGDLQLLVGLQRSLPLGAEVNPQFQADDVNSQIDLGKKELDKDGKPTDGIHENVIVDTSLTTLFQLYMRAYAELEMYGRPITTIRYSTRGVCQSGQKVYVNLSKPPCHGDFLIKEVTIDQIHDESDELSPRYNVTANQSPRFELNDLLLQIDGKKNGKVSGGGSSSTSTAGAIQQIDRTVGITIDGGGGAAITAGVKGFIQVPKDCVIQACRILSNDPLVTSGTIQIDIWKSDYTHYPPTVADSITHGNYPTMVGVTFEDTTLAGWDTSISAGDILGFKVISASGVTRITLTLSLSS